jgi:hypothetical protein
MARIPEQNESTRRHLHGKPLAGMPTPFLLPISLPANVIIPELTVLFGISFQ